MEQLQDPPSDLLHLFIAGPYRFLQVRDLLCLLVRLLDDHGDPINQLAIGQHGRHHRLITRWPLLDMIPGGLDAPDMPTTVMMSIGPIETKDFAPAPTMIRGHNRAMRRHQPLRRMVKIFERVFPPVFIFLLSKTDVNPKGLQGLTDYSD